ncbi:15138_t:CDS:2, partial [Rhizophagus irregularis]
MWKRDLFTRIKPVIPRIHPSFVWTHLSPEVSQKETGKPTSSTADVTKPVDSRNQTPVNDDVTLMDELGLLGEEEQSSSKTTDKTSSSIQIIKETSDQATSPIEVVSTTPGNPENLDDLISKELSSGQIQRPIYCINDLRKRYPICTSADDMETDDLRIP